MYIIVTGGTKGIGRALVDLFAEKGHHVAFCARTESEVQEIKSQLNAKYPNKQFIGAVCDMSHKDEINAFAKVVLNQFPTIDVLINNAGLYYPGSIIDAKEGELEAQIKVNLMSAYCLTRALLPKFLSQAKGHIFNMCSIAALKAYPGGGAYSISKYALLGFSENLRYELMDKGIKVTTVLPGATYTDSWSKTDVKPERIMAASDIALSIYNATNLSPQAVVERIILRPQLGDL